MSHVQNESPTTINANTELLWPDDLPDAPQFQEANNPPKNSTCTELESDESQHWTEIMAEQAARLSVVRRLSVERWAEPLYNDLPNSEINWELDGPHTVCRVVGLSCYGRDYKKVHGLKVHLGSKPHRDHDASLAQASPALSVAAVPKRAIDEQISPVPPKKCRLKHTIETTTGENLTLELKPWREVLEQHERALRYPPWREIPDSDEDSDNEALA